MLWAIALVVGFVLSSIFAEVPHAGVIGTFFDAIAAVSLACMVIPWFFWLLIRIYGSFNANLDAAMSRSRARPRSPGSFNESGDAGRPSKK